MIFTPFDLILNLSKSSGCSEELCWRVDTRISANEEAIRHHKSLSVQSETRNGFPAGARLRASNCNSLQSDYMLLVWRG